MVGPEMHTALGLDQLRRDPEPTRALPHRTFKHVSHAQFAPDLFHIDGLALVSETRIACDDEQPADAGEGGDDLLDHAVREIFLVGIAAQVRKWHYGNGGLVG